MNSQKHQQLNKDEQETVTLSSESTEKDDLELTFQDNQQVENISKTPLTTSKVTFLSYDTIIPFETVKPVSISIQDNSDLYMVGFCLGMVTSVVATPLVALLLVQILKNPHSSRGILAGIGAGWMAYCVSFFIAGMVLINTFHPSPLSNYSYEIGVGLVIASAICFGMGILFTILSWKTNVHIDLDNSYFHKYKNPYQRFEKDSENLERNPIAKNAIN